ncbi:MAG: heavy metal translocating P-type ATPase [Bryobacteraceae bacterium]
MANLAPIEPRVEQVTCGLCGLSVGRSPVVARERTFCCAGCANVYTILEESGVMASGQDFRETEIFRESLRLGLISNGHRSEPEPALDGETREAVFHLSGMWCTACGWLIEHALRGERGIASAEVLFASDLLKVRYSPKLVPPGRIEARVARLGYRAQPFRDGDEAKRKDDLMLRLGIAGFLYLNVNDLSWVFYVAFFESISDTMRRLVPFLLLALATPAVFYSGWPILRLAAIGLRERTVRMETLLALGILSAYVLSAVAVFRGGTHFYFDTACAIVALVLAGKVLERGAKEKTARAVSALYRLMPAKVRLVEGGRESFVTVEALEPGRRFVVRPGERIPADGVVVDGESAADESVLTGESEPRRKTVGDAVIAGSLNTSGALEIEATRTGGDSTLAHLVQSVEHALSTRAPIERQVDRVSRYFVPAVIVLALAMFLLPIPREQALMRAIAVLVIACPCALGIATPLAITAAIGSASRRGILISDARVLEAVHGVNVVLLDKTGTVTEQRLEEIPREHLPLLASLEARSEHPVAKAIVARNTEPLLGVTGVRVHPGFGIEGTVDGRRVRIGSARFLGAAEAGYEIDGVFAGSLKMASRLRADAKALVAALRRRDVKTYLISGDTAAVTAEVAGEIGADGFEAGVLPEGKAEIVKRYQAGGATVAMIGDGVNDAPALAAADLGIAIGSGTDLAMKAAPVTLMSDSLLRVEDVFALSRRALRVIHWNLFWAFAYNAAGLVLAAIGVVHPIIAAVAMMVSSLSVVVSAGRLARD